jgi:hypothetical protein
MESDRRNPERMYDLESVARNVTPHVLSELVRMASSRFKLRMKNPQKDPNHPEYVSIEASAEQLYNKQVSYVEQFLKAKDKLVNIWNCRYSDKSLDDLALRYMNMNAEQKSYVDITEAALKIGVRPCDLIQSYNEMLPNLEKFYGLIQPECSISDFAISLFEQKEDIDYFSENHCDDLKTAKSKALKIYSSAVKTKDANLLKVLEIAADSYFPPAGDFTRQDVLDGVENRMMSFVADYRSVLAKTLELGPESHIDINPEELAVACLQGKIQRELHEPARITKHELADDLFVKSDA